MTHRSEVELLGRVRAGTFTLRDADDLGYSERTRRRRLGEGWWVEVCPTVYAMRGTRLTVHLREEAVLRWLGPERVRLSHWSAARRHGWVIPEVREAWVSVPWDVRLPALDGVHVHRTRHLSPAVLRAGAPCTPLARTLVDLGQLAERHELADLVTGRLQRRETTLAALLREADRVHHRAGTGLLRDVARELGPAHESYLDRLLAGGLRARRLSHWTPQLQIWHAGELLAIADFGDEEARLLVEADGFHYHGSKAQQRRDEARDRLLARIGGWQTLRYGTDEVVRALPATVDEIEAIRRGRLAQLAA